MKQQIKYTSISDFYQQKLFQMHEFKINKDDEVVELLNILEGLDLTDFKKLFQHKTKVNPIRLLAVIIFAYSRKVSSSREIEQLCNENLKFQYLLDFGTAPDHSTITKFLKKCKPVLDDIIFKFNNKVLELNNIDTENVYIDGTKIEAYANRYSFVWKKSILKNRVKLLVKTNNLIEEASKIYNIQFSNLNSIMKFIESKEITFVSGRGKRKSIDQKIYEKAKMFFNKYNEYDEKLDILGDRNSYSKTDKDATFMRMKDDYMRNGQLKPGYNLQIAVSSQLIVDYEIYPNPTDVKTLIPFLKGMKNKGIELKNIVADAGYESLENYQYIEQNNWVSYIKPQYYEKSKKRKFKNDLDRVENLIYDDRFNTLSRADGYQLKYIEDKIYNGLKYKVYFNEHTNKRVTYNYSFRQLSINSRNNIKSEIGKQLRMNRSIQVEGAFAVIKENMKLRKLKIRGKEAVKAELGLMILGYNFKIHMYKKKNKKIGNILHELKNIS